MSKVPDTPAIKWGRENEQNAILDLEKELNGSITNTGLFVSRICPYIGASPDGIFQDSLIEIKCPFILKDVLPTDLRFLSKEQRSNFCCEQTLNGYKLKKSHKYYAQVMCQIFVTGYSKCIFCV